MMPMIRDLIQAFLFVQHQEGWRSAFGLTMQFLLLPFFEYHRGFLLHKSLAEPINIPSPKMDVTIRQATPDDGALFETIVPRLRVRRFVKKMQDGDICFIAVQGERIVRYVFAGFADGLSVKDAPLELGPKEAYFWSGYTLPQYRSKGIAKVTHLSLCRWLQEQGYESTVLLVDRHNTTCLAHCLKMGYQVLAQLTYLRILRWKMYRYLPVEEPL